MDVAIFPCQLSELKHIAQVTIQRGSGSIPATCITGYLFATDKVHVKQTDLCVRANNVSYEALDDLSGTPSFDLEFDLEDDPEHKNKGHIRIQRPKLDI